MQRLVRKVASVSRRETPLSQIRVGSSSISLGFREGSICASLEGVPLMEVGGASPKENAFSFLSLLASRIMETDPSSSGRAEVLRLVPKKDSLFESAFVPLQDSMKVNLGDDAISWKIRVRPIEEIELRSPSAQASMPLLDYAKKYAKEVSRLPCLQERLINRAGILSRHKMKQSMWGSETPQALLEGVRQGLPSLEDSLLGTEREVCLSQKALQRLVLRSEKDVQTPEDGQYMRVVLSPAISTGWDSILGNTVGLLCALSPLRRIDRVFLQSTTNPASWFLPSNVMEDFNELYDHLLDFVVQAPLIEQGLMAPLECVGTDGP